MKQERMADLIVKSAVKEALDENNVSAGFYEVLDDEVAELLEDAARRTEANADLRDISQSTWRSST